MRNLENTTIFYGKNEAGKSTIMSFIHSILFGFPTKAQVDLRYEPKKHAKYGGQLVVTLPQGKAVIERVRGKATGDVKVVLEDGTQGGEELLQQLLSHMDKALYQSIFSFNLHGLQNVQQMKNEDLGKFLFSTGALGTDRLLLAEATIKKELDSRYKPNGKKPLINEKIAEIKGLHQELKKAEQQNDQYWQYVEEKDGLEWTVKTLNIDLVNKQNMFTRVKEWKRYLPLMNEQHSLKEEWDKIAHRRFPEEGMKLFEELKQTQFSCEQKINTIVQKIQELQAEIKSIHPNEELLATELEIQTAVENLPLYEQLTQEYQQTKLQLADIDQEMIELQQKLHIKMDDDIILKSNTSFIMKEKTAAAWREAARLLEKKEALDNQFYQTKRELEGLEEQLHSLNNKLLSPNEREELQRQKNLAESRKLNERGLAELQNQFQRLNHLAAEEAKQNKTQHTQTVIGMLVFSILFLILAAWSFFEQQWIVLAISGAGLLYVILVQSKKPSIKQSTYRNELNALKLKEKNWTDENSPSNTESTYSLDQRLESDQTNREQERILRMKWEQKNDQYEKILEAYEQWEMDSRVNKVLLDELGRDLGVPTDFSQHFIYDAFLLVEKLKSAVLQKQKWRKKLDHVQSEIVQIETRLKDLARKFLDTENNQLFSVAYQLKEQLKNEQKKQILHYEKGQILVGFEEDEKLLQAEYEGYLSRLKQLFTMAGVDTEEDFMEAGKLATRKKAVSDRLKQIENQLSLSGIGQDDQQQFYSINVEQQLTELQIEQSALQDQLSSTQERLAEVKYQIAILEDGGTYAELLHQYRLKQSELNTEAKSWAKFAVAQHLLNHAVDKYKNERLPKMIKKAESFLRELTDDQYIRIHTQQVGSSFLIESRDHLFYEPRELSQATSEQIYVSIRLALATTLYEKYQFPIIIDDSFVNFDQHRTQKVIRLLGRLKGHQILFFTCHQHLLQYFTKGKLITMGEYDSSMERVKVK